MTAKLCATCQENDKVRNKMLVVKFLGLYLQNALWWWILPVWGTHAHEVLFVKRNKHWVNKSTKWSSTLIYRENDVNILNTLQWNCWLDLTSCDIERERGHDLWNLEEIYLSAINEDSLINGNGWIEKYYWKWIRGWDLLETYVAWWMDGWMDGWKDCL